MSATICKVLFGIDFAHILSHPADLFFHIRYNKDKTEAGQAKAISIIGYLGIFFLVPLLGGKGNRFAQYHANQGLVLFICAVICNIIAYIPTIGIIGTLLSLVLFVFMIIGMVNAAHLEAKPLPLIGNITLIKSY